MKLWLTMSCGLSGRSLHGQPEPSSGIEAERLLRFADLLSLHARNDQLILATRNDLLDAAAEQLSREWNHGHQTPPTP